MEALAYFTNPPPTQVVINHRSCHEDAVAPPSAPTMQGRQEPREKGGHPAAAAQRRIIFPMLHRWGVAPSADRHHAVPPNRNGCGPPGSSSSDATLPAQADLTSSTTSVEPGAGFPPSRTVNLQGNNPALDTELGSSSGRRIQRTRMDQQDKLSAIKAEEVEATVSSAADVESSPAPTSEVVATARPRSPRLAERKKQPHHPRSILHPPSPPRSPRSSPPLPALRPITSFSSASSCESMFSSSGAGGAAGGERHHVDFGHHPEHDAAAPSSTRIPVPPEQWRHLPTPHLALSPRTTMTGRARSSSVGSAAAPHAPSSRIGVAAAPVRRHDSEPVLVRSVSFDPRVWVVEYDEGSPRRDKGDKWFSAAELGKFKSDAVEIVQRHAFGGGHPLSPRMRGSPRCAAGRRFHCSISSLSDIFLNSDDEDEDEDDDEIDGGSSTEEKREVSAPADDPSKKSFLRKLIPCGGLPFSHSHGGAPLKQQQPGAETEIRTVLIVDGHSIFRSLLTKAVQVLFPHGVQVDTARSSGEALRMIEEAAAKKGGTKNGNRNKDDPHGDRQDIEGGDGEVPLHGYDVILVEERLHSGVTVVGAPTRSGPPPAHGGPCPSKGAAANPQEDEDGNYATAVSQVQSAGDDLVQRRGLPPGAPGSRLIERISHEERRAAEGLSLPRGRDAAQSPSQWPLQAGVGDVVDGSGGRIRFSLLIGLSAHLDEDGESLRGSGTDMVWGKPPPPMDGVLRKQVLDALLNKRGRGRHHPLSVVG